MTSDNPQSDASIDSELRNIPLPDGLLERLARIPTRDRPKKGTVPGTSQANLRETSQSRQGDSPLFETMPTGSLTDEEIDEALRYVPLPRTFLRRLRRPVDPGARRFQIQRLALAAALLMALGLIYTIAIAGFMVAMSGPPDPLPPVSVPGKTVDEKLLPSPSSYGVRLQPHEPAANRNAEGTGRL